MGAGQASAKESLSFTGRGASGEGHSGTKESTRILGEEERIKGEIEGVGQEQITEDLVFYIKEFVRKR